MDETKDMQRSRQVGHCPIFSRWCHFGSKTKGKTTRKERKKENKTLVSWLVARKRTTTTLTTTPTTTTTIRRKKHIQDLSVSEPLVRVLRLRFRMGWHCRSLYTPVTDGHQSKTNEHALDDQHQNQHHGGRTHIVAAVRYCACTRPQHPQFQEEKEKIIG